MTTFAWTVTNYADLDLATVRNDNIDVLFSYRLVSTVYNVAQITAYLDAAQAAGLRVLLSCRELGKNVCIANGDHVLTPANLATLSAWAANFCDHPALWGWYADDEGSGATYPAAERVKVYNTLKALNADKQVMEVHYHIESGGYAAAAHDVFGLDGYPYVYDDFPTGPNYGCISKSTGLVTSSANETLALDYYEANMENVKLTLDAADDTYFAVAQAFRHESGSTPYYCAMPPVGGFDKLWARIGAAGFDTFGVGWFLFDCNDTYTSPEVMTGYSEDGDTTKVAEIAAINAQMMDCRATADTDHIDLEWAATTGPYLIERRTL